MLARLLSDPPDLVFNFAEGQGIARSREARVPAVLEMLDIPLHRLRSPDLCRDPGQGLRQTPGATRPGSPARAALCSVRRTTPWPPSAPTPTFRAFPYCSSRPGKARARASAASAWSRTPASLLDVVESLRRDHRQPILVEEFIAGEELTVGLIGNDDPRDARRDARGAPAAHRTLRLQS